MKTRQRWKTRGVIAILLASCGLTLAGCPDYEEGDPSETPRPGDIPDPKDCTDESGNEIDPIRYFADSDGDGFGDPTQVLGDVCPGDTTQPGGVTDNSDCDDENAAVHPGAEDTCNGINDDCDNYIDEELTVKTYYQDVDGDGYGLSGSTTTACAQPSGYATVAGDCNDTSAAIKPGAKEVCDGLDNDCDTVVDGPSAEGAKTYYQDFDVDGYGVESVTSIACVLPFGYAKQAGDCNDADKTINPGAAELCGDDVDNDCDGEEDEDFDDDMDGYASCGEAADCDDDDSHINPGATEVCDGEDNNCDGVVDEGYDEDGDGSCGSGGATADCDDTDITVYPDAPELCDGKDNDCNDEVDNDPTFDADLDGYTYCGSAEEAADCDDTDDAQYPGAPELCDGVDQNCDGSVSSEVDADKDGYRQCQQDCNEADPNTHPGATEVCDGKDQDCDKLVDDGFDQDRDGYYSCEEHDSTSANADCGDTDPNTHPGAAEEACDEVDYNCDGLIPATSDGDGDGQTRCNGDCNDADKTIYEGAAEICDGKDNDCNSKVDDGISCRPQ